MIFLRPLTFALVLSLCLSVEAVDPEAHERTIKAACERATAEAKKWMHPGANPVVAIDKGSVQGLRYMATSIEYTDENGARQTHEMGVVTDNVHLDRMKGDEEKAIEGFKSNLLNGEVGIRSLIESNPNLKGNGFPTKPSTHFYGDEAPIKEIATKARSHTEEGTRRAMYEGTLEWLQSRTGQKVRIESVKLGNAQYYRNYFGGDISFVEVLTLENERGETFVIPVMYRTSDPHQSEIVNTDLVARAAIDRFLEAFDRELFNDSNFRGFSGIDSFKPASSSQAHGKNDKAKPDSKPWCDWRSLGDEYRKKWRDN